MKFIDMMSRESKTRYDPYGKLWLQSEPTAYNYPPYCKGNKNQATH